MGEQQLRLTTHYPFPVSVIYLTLHSLVQHRAYITAAQIHKIFATEIQH